MSVADDVESGIKDVLAPAWTERNGTVVPATDDIVLRNGAVNIDATYLYADLANSSALGQKVKKPIAAKVMRAYLNAATRILKNYDGQIRSFDGDRVMAIFVGSAKNTNAVRAGLALNWAVQKVLGPQLKAKWSDLDQYWTVAHGVGIDTGEAMLVRGGVRNSNDLISVGAAPNVAAKLSELRNSPSTYVTKRVYNNMNDANETANGKSMWTTHGHIVVGGSAYTVYASTWWWKP